MHSIALQSFVNGIKIKSDDLRNLVKSLIVWSMMHIRILALLWIGTSMKDWQKKKKKIFLSMQNYTIKKATKKNPDFLF